MTPADIAHALTSGALGPALGAVLVLGAWLLTRIRAGVPMGEQLRHAAMVARPFVAPAVAAGGLVLLAGGSYGAAIATALTALLTAAGFVAPKPGGSK